VSWLAFPAAKVGDAQQRIAMQVQETVSGQEVGLALR